MKKYELLEKAMRDYPEGTRFTSAQAGMPNVSTGQFEMSLGGNIVMIPRCDGGVIYSERVWAEIIPKKGYSFKTYDGVTINYDQEYFTVEDGKVVKFVLCSTPNGELQFSTNEAAEKWLKEQNKPKVVEVKLFDRKTANIYVDLIRVFDGSNTINLKPSDLEDMMHAYNSLQS